MATLTCYITANGDDGQEWDGNWYIDGDSPGSKYAGRFGGPQIYMADRFQVNLAPGATINSVTWNLYKAGDQNGTPNILAYADDVDSATQPSASAFPSARTSTTATYTKTLTAGEWGTAGWLSIDVTSIFSEVYARGGWAANNYFMLIMVGTLAGAGGDYVGFEDYSAGGSNHSYITIDYTASDTTAPTLSSATQTATGPTTATVGCTTNEANGTMYCVVTTSATQPSIAQIKAGQNHTGAAAVYASSQSITTTGAKTFSATGLTVSTAYYGHFVHTDAAANDSSRLSTSSVTTEAPTISSGTPTSTSDTTPNIGFTTNYSAGTGFAVVSTSALTGITAEQIAAGTDQSDTPLPANQTFTGSISSTTANLPQGSVTALATGTWYAAAIHDDGVASASNVLTWSFTISASGSKLLLQLMQY